MTAQAPIINPSTFDALWGMDGTVYSGIITSFTQDDDADNGQVLDNNGYVVADLTYNQKSKFTLELILQAGTTLPALGAIVTLNGVANCIIRTRQLKYGQKDWRKYTFSADSFVNLLT